MSREAKEKFSIHVMPPNKFLKSDKFRVYLRKNKIFLVLHHKKSDLLTKHFQQSIQVKM